MLFKKRSLTFLLLLFIIICSFSNAKAQYFDLDSNKKYVTIPFRLIRNLVIIKLKINNAGPFNFILDTGVGLMLITEPKLVDSINLTSKSIIKIPGLGIMADNEAYLTSDLKISIPGLKSHNVNAAILKEDYFNLSNFAGMPVGGLLGYDFFSNTAVKINFSDSTITVCRPTDLPRLGKYSAIPVTIEERRSYLKANIIFPGGKMADSKLIIDIGAGHPVSVENTIKNNSLPKNTIAASLGIGLNGPIEGYIGRINELDIGKYKIKNVIASFPDDSKPHAHANVSRDGNLGLGILKKFDVIFDYPGNMLYLKPGKFFNDPFEHDMSGLEYYSTSDFAHVIISRVDPNSPADNVGLEKGDEIVAVNFKPVSQMRLEDLDAIFESRDNRSLLLEIYHDKKYDFIILTLKRRI